MINWKELTTVSEFEEINLQSRLSGSAFFLFKHSTRCMTSTMAKRLVERNMSVSVKDAYLINVIEERELSNYVAREMGVQHQSPQALVIEKGSVVYEDSHSFISPEKIEEILIKG